jgi:glycosyltransferase involved in cell wall biosynthesis
MKTIITLGRLIPRKGFDLLIRAFQTVLKQEDLQLILIGEGPEHGNLVRLSQQLGINHRVHFVGYQTNPYKYIAKADIFICPSLWEGFGNVVIEAMACGAPVIASDCPFGPGEIIADGQNGILVPANDASRLAEAILRLCNDSNLRERVARNGKERAQAFDVGKAVSAYEAFFDRQIGYGVGTPRQDAVA